MWRASPFEIASYNNSATPAMLSASPIPWVTVLAISLRTMRSLRAAVADVETSLTCGAFK